MALEDQIPECAHHHPRHAGEARRPGPRSSVGHQKSREALAPARTVHRTHECLADLSQRCGLLPTDWSKDLVRKTVSHKQDLVYLVGAQPCLTPKCKDLLPVEILEIARGFATAD